ncbi:Adenine nucleotide alpha hydrolases-like superfamily protein [Striga hermonthica]|uniref:Adenine nucleotide alpha hydrolases-like superfamily protein n=1 Tax=Striga hermonthica TaxID=68872 RepID=A0A9N7N0X3_STRHE|nr:Adenine nucleotide alpha hydrolases-like superfamily protein [Striga hermonthica]
MEEPSGGGGGGAGKPEAAMNVLVAIDDGEESFQALDWAVSRILKPNGGDDDNNASKVVTIAHVLEPLPHYAFPGGYVLESSTKAQEENAARILSRAFEMCRDYGLNAKTVILEGDPKDRICRAVEEMNIHLLVVGSRGLGQIKRAFLGSVSDYCAHHAKCAVLVVKPPPKKKTHTLETKDCRPGYLIPNPTVELDPRRGQGVVAASFGRREIEKRRDPRGGDRKRDLLATRLRQRERSGDKVASVRQ